MASGFSNVLPTRWGLRFIEWLLILIGVALLVKFIAPTSGLGIAIHTVCGWLAVGITYLANITARFLTWL
jgi:hypothetical protein